jgi:ribose/xylose/arabinose/galactoside ABC-type transport system permease subunit
MSTQVSPRGRAGGFLTKYWLFFFTILVFIVFSVLQPRFLSVNNIMSMLSSTCILALTGMGETLIFCVGETDFAVGMELSLSAVFIAKVLDNPGMSRMYFPVFILTLIVGAAFGAVNVFLHAKIKIPSFVATLGTSLIATGIGKYLTDGGSISSRRWPAVYTLIGQGYIAGVIPISVVVTLAITIAMWVYSEKTKNGKLFYAVGSSPVTCKYVGINVAAQKVKAFILCALLCAIAGIMQTSMLRSATPYMGSDTLNSSLTVLMLGATFIKPGVFNIPGTIVASVLLRIISFGLTMLGAPSFAFDLAQGGLLLFAISLVTLIHRKQSKSIG